MKIYTKAVYTWDGTKYTLDSSESFEYDGPVALTCGATSGQKTVASSATSFMKQAQSQAGSIFGASSQVFSSLMSAFAPIVAAGPSQQGFSPQELAARNSQAITQTGQEYKNAKEALGENIAAQGGGNAVLPSGTTTAAETNLAIAGANQTSNELNQITQENYATGRQNWANAVQGELAAPSVFNPTTEAENAATGSTNAASTAQNDVAQANVGAWNGVLGVAGELGGSLIKGLTGQK